MWRDHIGFYPDTEQKADQCRREIAPGRASDEAGIILEGEHVRSAMLTQKLGHHLRASFRHRSPLRSLDAARSRSLRRRSWRSLPHVASCPLDQGARGFHL